VLILVVAVEVYHHVVIAASYAEVDPHPGQVLAIRRR
jgi:hypothetical protein